MARIGFVTAAACAALLLGSAGAHAFTVINQNNYAAGGAKMLNSPNTTTTPQTDAYASHFSDKGPGYGGYGVFDFSAGSTSHDNFPSFPGQNNHLTPGANAGMLQYGATPGRY